MKGGHKLNNENNIQFENSLCFTGHRPKKLPSYDYRHPQNMKMLLKLKALIERFIIKRNVHTFISGMALGIDIWSAQIVLSLKKKYPHIKLVCAIPCKEQYKLWRENDVEIYHDILSQTDYVHYVSEEPYTHWCMNKRNEWMVDKSNFVLSIWDGTKGGTGNCVKYALKKQRSIINIHPITLEINSL